MSRCFIDYVMNGMRKLCQKSCRLSQKFMLLCTNELSLLLSILLDNDSMSCYFNFMAMTRTSTKMMPVKAGQAAVLSYLGFTAAKIASLEGISERQAYHRIDRGLDEMEIPVELVNSTREVHRQMQAALKRINELINIPITSTLDPRVMSNVSKAAFAVMDMTLGYVQRLQEREAASHDPHTKPDTINETQAIADLNTSVKRLNETLEQRTAHTAIDAEHTVIDATDDDQGAEVVEPDASNVDQCDKDSNQ